jgi:hypothetical protein
VDRADKGREGCCECRVAVRSGARCVPLALPPRIAQSQLEPVIAAARLSGACEGDGGRSCANDTRRTRQSLGGAARKKHFRSVGAASGDLRENQRYELSEFLGPITDGGRAIASWLTVIQSARLYEVELFAHASEPRKKLAEFREMMAERKATQGEAFLREVLPAAWVAGNPEKRLALGR